MKKQQIAKHQTVAHRTFCIWITGLPAAGKSTLAIALRVELQSIGVHPYVLDGDQVREGLNRDLGYTRADRAESVRRVSEVGRLMVDAGLVVIVSLISPFRLERLAARNRFEAGTFIEVFLDTPLDVCEARDPKGHYGKARSGELKEFTGISSAYEPPEAPELHLIHDGTTAEVHVARIMAHLKKRGLCNEYHDGCENGSAKT